MSAPADSHDSIPVLGSVGRSSHSAWSLTSAGAHTALQVDTGIDIASSPPVCVPDLSTSPGSPDASPNGTWLATPPSRSHSYSHHREWATHGTPFPWAASSSSGSGIGIGSGSGSNSSTGGEWVAATQSRSGHLPVDAAGPDGRDVLDLLLAEQASVHPNEAYRDFDGEDRGLGLGLAGRSRQDKGKGRAIAPPTVNTRRPIRIEQRTVPTKTQIQAQEQTPITTFSTGLPLQQDRGHPASVPPDLDLTLESASSSGPLNTVTHAAHGAQTPSSPSSHRELDAHLSHLTPFFPNDVEAGRISPPTLPASAIPTSPSRLARLRPRLRALHTWSFSKSRASRLAGPAPDEEAQTGLFSRPGPSSTPGALNPSSASPAWSDARHRSLPPIPVFPPLAPLPPLAAPSESYQPIVPVPVPPSDLDLDCDADWAAHVPPVAKGDRLGTLGLHYLPPHLPTFACARCAEVVALQDELVSKSFNGRSGRAYLMNTTINTRIGKREDRKLLTGLHTVADLVCATCATSLGWVYIRAPNGEQRYKEGRYILEAARIIKENNW